MKNYDDWTIPEAPPKPTPKKRGIYYLSPEDMQEANKSMKEKGIKVEDVKKLPPIEEIHGLDTPPPAKVVEANSLSNSMIMTILTICTLANAFMSLKTILENKITSMQML